MAKKIRMFLLVGMSVLGFARPAVAFSFSGEIDFRAKKAEISILSQGKPCTLRFEQTEARQFAITLEIPDLRTTLFDITTSLQGTLDMLPTEPGSRRALRGQLASRDTLLNHKPVAELSSRFEVKNGILEIVALDIGAIQCRGRVHLRPPYPVELGLQFTGLEMDQFFPETDGADVWGTGKVDGRVSLAGTTQKLLINGRVVAYPVEASGTDYQRAVLNFSGIYPIVTLSESNIIQPDGITFNVFGRIDLSSAQPLDQQIAALPREALVKDKADRLEWTLKKMGSNDRSGTTELKYFLRKGDQPDGRSTESTGILGVERRVQF